MASFLDGLYKLLKDKFKFTADILKNVKEIKIGCDESVHVTNQILYLPFEKLDSETLLKLQKTIPKGLDPSNRGAYLALEQSKERLTELKAVNTSSNFDIQFFEDKIQPVDYIILKIAAYCDHLFLSGEKTKGSQVKQEAILRYGEKARNIINLYSSRYFENTIKPLYEILQDSRDSNFTDKFKEMYRIIVNEEIFTLFVSSGQTEEQVLQKLMEKISINREYGANKINIHGINTENVKKIEALVESVKEEIEGEPNIIKTGQAIMVTLYLKKQDGTETSRRNDLVSMV